MCISFLKKKKERNFNHGNLSMLLPRIVYNKIAFAFLSFFCVSRKERRGYFTPGIEEFDRTSRNERSRMSENALAKRRNILWRGGSFESEGGQIERKKRGGRTRGRVRSREVGAFAIVTSWEHVSRTTLLVLVIQTPLNNFYGS